MKSNQIDVHLRYSQLNWRSKCSKKTVFVGLFSKVKIHFLFRSTRLKSKPEMTNRRPFPFPPPPLKPHPIHMPAKKIGAKLKKILKKSSSLKNRKARQH